MFLVAMVLLLACTRLLPGKGTCNALPGKGIWFGALALLLAMAVPGEGILGLLVAMAMPGQGKLGFLMAMVVPAQGSNFLCWWRLRERDGKLWFVWPSGFWDELPEEWETAVDAFFQTEPEMAAYMAGMSATSGEVPEYPPVWHQASGMWIVSRHEPEVRLQVVGRAEDMDRWSDQLYPSRWAGDTRQEAPGNWAPVEPPQPTASARDGSQNVWTDGRAIHVWRDGHYEPGQGSWHHQPEQGSWNQGGQGSWNQPGQGSWNQPGQGSWGSWNEPGQGCTSGWSPYYNQYGRRKEAAPPPGPPKTEGWRKEGWKGKASKCLKSCFLKGRA